MNAMILGGYNSFHNYHVPFVYSIIGNLTLKESIFAHLIMQKVGNVYY